jgi:integrase
MKIVEPIRKKGDLVKVESILALNKRDLLFFVMGTNSGLRISDILALKVKDVKNRSYVEIVEKKTKKRKRFPLNSKLKPLIADFTKGRKGEEPLFKTRFDNPLDRVQAYRIINQACKEVGIEQKVGTHTLRKSFGYHHYQQFKDVVILQKILNHSSPCVTMRYTGIEQDNIDKSYAKFVL